MKIKKIQMVGYKRFHDLTIDLGDNPARIVALVGPNGCGKSSVFDAILYRMTKYGGMIGNTGYRDYSYHSLQNDPTYSEGNVQIELDIGDFCSIMSQRTENEQFRKMVSFRSSFRYNGSLDVREIRSVSDISRNDFGASCASDIDQRIEESYRRLQSKYNAYLNEKDCRPSEARKHIVGELNESIEKCLSLRIESFGNIDAGKGSFYFKKEDTPTSFNYNVLSSGEKEVLDILLDIYLRQEDYNDSIYIIDEPELHLNTSIQRQLLIEINKMIPDNCQIWIATHSIGFLRALQEDFHNISQVIYFNANNQWASQPYVLNPICKNRASWNMVFKTALEDLTSLVAPKRIVYCEGRAEPRDGYIERGLDADVYNGIFNENYPDTLFVSSGGNTELDQRSNIAISILSKVFSNIEILVLKDRDMASGKDIDEHGRQLYLQTNPQNHRVLKRFELENYIYDKEVLIEYCRRNGTQFDEQTYDQKINDIYNQHVKDETGLIKHICGLDGSINAEVFKRRVAECIHCNMTVYHELERVIFFRE